MRKLVIGLLFLSTLSFTVVSQENKPFSKMDVSLRFSTMGLGLEVSSPLNSNFKTRAGVDYMRFTTGYYNTSLGDNSGNLRKAFGYTPDYRTKVGLSLFHGHLLVDYYPVGTGVFYITTGVYAGFNKILPDGFLSNPDDNSIAILLPGEKWPVVELSGHQIDVTNGHIDDLEVKLGRTIKPYLGFGLGRTFGKSKFGYKVELGVLYQGNYSVRQSGIKINVTEADLNDFEDVYGYIKKLKFWPMVNFQLTYNIF